MVETVNDLIKMQLKDYLASGWSLERRRLMAEERKRGGVLHIHPFWDRGRCQGAQHGEIRPRLGFCSLSLRQHTYRPPTNSFTESLTYIAHKRVGWNGQVESDWLASHDCSYSQLQLTNKQTVIGCLTCQSALLSSNSRGLATVSWSEGQKSNVWLLGMQISTYMGCTTHPYPQMHNSTLHYLSH